MEPFRINAIKDGEENKFVITVGESIASTEVFESQEDAEKFLEENCHLSEFELQLIGAMTIEITKLFNKTKQKK